MYSALILLYAATAAVAGYVAASYYKQMQGTLWVRNILLTCVIFAGPLFCTFCFNNTLAIVYEVRGPDTCLTSSFMPPPQTTAALPWQTIVILIVLWALVTLPLTIAGGIVGSAWGMCTACSTCLCFLHLCFGLVVCRVVPSLCWMYACGYQHRHLLRKPKK